MKVLIKGCFFVNLALCIICAAVIAAARRDPVPSKLARMGFTHCAGRTCLAGVSVDYTTWQGAFDQLGGFEVRHTGNYRTADVRLPGGIDLVMSSGLHISHIQAMRINPNYGADSTAQIEARDVITFLGAPCRVHFGRGVVGIDFPDVRLLHIGVATDPDFRDLRSLPQPPYVYLVKAGDGCTSELHPSIRVAAWRGFASAEQYRRAYWAREASHALGSPSSP